MSLSRNVKHVGRGGFWIFFTPTHMSSISSLVHRQQTTQGELLQQSTLANTCASKAYNVQTGKRGLCGQTSHPSCVLIWRDTKWMGCWVVLALIWKFMVSLISLVAVDTTCSQCTSGVYCNWTAAHTHRGCFNTHQVMLGKANRQTGQEANNKKVPSSLGTARKSRRWRKSREL